MGTKFTSPSASGYNASPPPDDGSTTASNKITWGTTIKAKLADPLYNWISATLSALASALNYSFSLNSGTYTTVAADNCTVIENTGSNTVSLGDAATMGTGYIVGIKNTGTGLTTVALITGTDTLDGTANGTITVPVLQTVWFGINQAGTGYDIIGSTSPYRQGANIASASTTVLDVYDGDYAHITGTTGITAFTLSKGRQMTLVFDSSLTITAGASLIVPLLKNGSDLSVAAGDSIVVRGEASSVVRVVSLMRSQGSPALATRGHISGLTLSTAGSSATMSIAAGQATDSGNYFSMYLAASISKTTSAWAVGSGNGGMDTGSIANSTWYHFYLIQRLDTGVTDVLFSLSASAPTLPTNYTVKRRIGSGKTDGSAQWTAFTQDGEYFRWAANVADISSTNPGTSAVSRVLTVPTGVNVQAYLQMSITDTGSLVSAYLSDLAATDVAASTTNAQAINDATSTQGLWSGLIRTDTSATIRSRVASSGAATVLTITTFGWWDTRGKN